MAAAAAARIPPSVLWLRHKGPVPLSIPLSPNAPLLGDTRCHDAAGPPALGNASSPAYPACTLHEAVQSHGPSSSSPVLSSAQARPSMPDGIITWTDQARIWQSRPPVSGNVAAPYPRPRRPTRKGRIPSTSGAMLLWRSTYQRALGRMGAAITPKNAYRLTCQ